ncbi:adenosine deaminase [Vreelandella venusta]|uniref:adenosine deaminase n=1 Tax=Vreelandella venusta TaxID=44935 RepID=UPI00201064B9|nr:adenosine deaminase [Halomonas venusta]UQI39301.1 adenosine deaminase [Halomonas venusta]
MNRNEIQLMEKGELHVHLNGLVSTDVIRNLLLRDRSDLPSGFDLERDLNISQPADSLASYLKPWQVLRLIPKSKSCLGLIVESAFLNLKYQNITFVEIRKSVIYIALLNKISVDEALYWVVSEIEEASERHKISAGLILTVSRGDYAQDHLRSLLEAYEKLGRPITVVGLDLAGNEDITSPTDTGSLFLHAKDKYGLKVTIHAGETGKIENIVSAVHEFGADRIGHGTAASKSVEVMGLLKEKDICIEVCPISNRLTNAVKKYESHPVIDFIDNNVPFVICSDNPSIHLSCLAEDYLEFYRETNSTQHLCDMYSIQKKYSFIKGLYGN